MLKRLGKYSNKLGKLIIYHSFILSNFNFCPLSWHFCSEANRNKIEKIQERALRFIYNDYNSTYENLLMVSKLPTLKVRRLRTMAIEVYTIYMKKVLHIYMTSSKLKILNIVLGTTLQKFLQYEPQGMV